MHKLGGLILMFSSCFVLATNAPANPDLSKRLEKFGCNFLAYVHNPKDKKATPLALCFKTHTETRGIYEASACVAVNIEPDSEYESPFYGAKGHWGAEGKCNKEIMEKLLAKKDEINNTVNPLSALQFKRQEGFEVEKIKDDFGLWPMVMERSDPKQNPKIQASHANTSSKTPPKNKPTKK